MNVGSRVSRWVLGALVVVGAALPVHADTFGLDPVHSFAIFRVKHNNVGYTYARINGPEGTIEYDAAKPEATSFDVTLKAANIDTGNAQRDTHLKSPTFLNSKDYPNLTFKSKSVKKADGDNLEVTGDITILGVSKPLTVKLERTGMTSGARPVVGFEGTFTIKRSDFGMKEMMDAVGDEIRITISIEAGKK